MKVITYLLSLWLVLGLIQFSQAQTTSLLIMTARADVKPAVADRYFTTSDHVRLHYRVSGTGKPLVIFPGYGQDASKFSAVYPALEKHYTIYCLDYRWLGKSDSPAYGYHIERLAKDAQEMIAAAKIDTFSLFGHSMGNSVA